MLILNLEEITIGDNLIFFRIKTYYTSYASIKANQDKVLWSQTWLTDGAAREKHLQKTAGALLLRGFKAT